MFQFADFFVVELTYSCNLKCEYCYLEDRHEYSNLVMSDETFRNFIDHIIYNGILRPATVTSPATLVLHGGEPLLLGCEALRSKVQYARAMFDYYNIPCNISIQTNGLLLTPEIVDMLAEYRVDIGISYDGDRANHLRTRDVSQAKQIYETIQEVQTRGIPVGVLSVITNENIDEIPSFEQKIGQQVKRIPVIDTSTPERKNEVPPQLYYEKLLRDHVESLEWLQLPRSDVRHDVDRHLFRAMLDVFTEHTDMTQSTCGFKFCGAGIRILSIQPNGAIHRCDRWDLKYRDEYYLSKPHTFDFLAIHQLRSAVRWNEILDRVNRETGCDVCYAKYSCGHQCQSLYHSKHGHYGVDKVQICGITKLLYNFVSENIIKIAQEIARLGEVDVIEDYIYRIRPAIARRVERENISLGVGNEGASITARNTK